MKFAPYSFQCECLLLLKTHVLSRKLSAVLAVMLRAREGLGGGGGGESLTYN